MEKRVCVFHRPKLLVLEVLRRVRRVNDDYNDLTTHSFSIVLPESNSPTILLDLFAEF